MMPRQPASDYVRVARTNISLAVKACGVADEAHIRRALAFLETAVAEIRHAEAGVRSAAFGDPAKLRRETLLLKRDIAIMLRVIDGCASLRRGLALRLGCSAPAYTPQGHSAAPPLPPSACEMQG
jgi:hypothetical protein